MREVAKEAIARCHQLAGCTEEPGRITRTFLSPPMRRVHELAGEWMRESRLEVAIDAVGNIRGTRGTGPRLLIGSHLDTVPNAGAYDGILGVVLGIALARLTQNALAVVGFSEEEGVRFGVPFIGSRALVGTARPLLDADPAIAQAIREYGLDPTRVEETAPIDANAYFEIHIEQGPVLEHLDLPLGVVEAIAGLSRWRAEFVGAANHAGTTPMGLRHDALAAAAEWILEAEQIGCKTEGLVATVGRCAIERGAANVVPGHVSASLDVRHSRDRVRKAAVEHLLESARAIGAKRGVKVEVHEMLDVAATAMNGEMVDQLAKNVPHRMTSGAGHDAMIMAQVMPAAMLFLRSPGGISHDPKESVLIDDVAAALAVAKDFVESWRG